MNKCDDGHEEIIFTSDDCPLCEMIMAQENLESILTDMYNLKESIESFLKAYPNPEEITQEAEAKANASDITPF